MSYSLRDVVQDGSITAPRYIHHLIKIGTSCFAYVVLLLVGMSVSWAAIFGGPALWLATRLKEMRWPTDPNPHTVSEHIGDALTDLTLTYPVLAVGLVAEGERGWAYTLLLLGLLAYLSAHRDARP